MWRCRRRSQENPPRNDYWDFRDLLTYEKERSERHNRFFSVFGLSVTGLYLVDMAAEIRAEIRASDYVFPLEREAGAQTQVGVLLPETDMLGALTVKKRLAFLCSIKGVDYDLGLAVYPNDATTPEQLLALAFNGQGMHGAASILI